MWYEIRFWQEIAPPSLNVSYAYLVMKGVVGHPKDWAVIVPIERWSLVRRSQWWW